MKRVQLFNSKEFALVDDSDFDRVSRHTWCLSTKKHDYRAVRANIFIGFSAGKKIRKTIYLHRFILCAQSGSEVDHINWNTLDNRQHNLRFCNRIQQMHNVNYGRGGKSRFQGVTHRFGKWRAHIRVQGKQITLGTAASEVQAARIYDAAKIKFFGQYAATNERIFGRYWHEEVERRRL